MHTPKNGHDVRNGAQDRRHEAGRRGMAGWTSQVYKKSLRGFEGLTPEEGLEPPT